MKKLVAAIILGASIFSALAQNVGIKQLTSVTRTVAFSPASGSGSTVDIEAQAARLSPTNLVTVGDSVTAGFAAGGTTIVNTYTGQNTQSPAYAYQVASNLGVAVNNVGWPNANCAYISSIETYSIGPTIPPRTVLTFNSGLNDIGDSASVSNLPISLYHSTALNAMTYLLFGSEAKFYPAGSSPRSANAPTVVSGTASAPTYLTGATIGTGWTNALWNGLNSTNSTNAIIFSNVYMSQGSGFIVSLDVGWDGTWGSNVVYIDGVSNVVLSQANTNVLLSAPFGSALQSFVVTNTQGTGWHTVVFSNITGCISGYSGPNLNYNVEWICLPEYRTNIFSEYVLSSTMAVPAEVDEARIPQLNLDLQSNVAVLKALSLPVNFVDITGVVWTNALGDGAKHPSGTQHTNIAQIIQSQISQGMAFTGLGGGIFPQGTIYNAGGFASLANTNHGSISAVVWTNNTGASVDVEGIGTIGNYYVYQPGGSYFTSVYFTAPVPLPPGWAVSNALNASFTANYLQFP